ncbi:MAG: hypothetical protein COU08_01650 [Candidatus Harrisonbacteria bacterium CG10_big_fil_rev_8_21_14_0_10_42_17]|uniref:Small ribosomal subunit protein bS6 n=1 Tax=Candidatus Harrisonbacteria bacterium CG10_big_fil_rev_8_21_14_0_10_42_17 TaxID=1974584 RepID=A0A2M6WIQ3_9BACT|nr:MAG: hypothetical protein COU08_01650 [Candidatus Harrisonbacteria bacterium CG10_big_fil_rev_8_21_14_0_10_42_17]
MAQKTQPIDEHSDAGVRAYELSVLLRAPEHEDSFKNFFQSLPLTITHTASFQALQLSFPIEKHDTALFGFFYFQTDSHSLSSIRDAVSRNEDVLRFILVTRPSIPKQPSSPESSQERRLANFSQSKSDLQQQEVLTNEALEEKLEEILK